MNFQYSGENVSEKIANMKNKVDDSSSCSIFSGQIQTGRIDSAIFPSIQLGIFRSHDGCCDRRLQYEEWQVFI